MTTEDLVELMDQVLSWSLSPGFQQTGTLNAAVEAGRKKSPIAAARHLRQIEPGTRPILGELLGPQVVLATVNQVKGLTFDFTWILVPGPRRFPHGKSSSFDEICRWWVAATRARHLLGVIVAEGVNAP